jgi:hypothetical protein
MPTAGCILLLLASVAADRIESLDPGPEPEQLRQGKPINIHVGSAGGDG